MARRKAPQSPTTAPRQHSLIWLQGLLCGAMATLATPTALLLGVLLGPALLAAHARSPAWTAAGAQHRPFQHGGSIDPLRTLWTTGHTIATATALLGNLRIVGMAWSAAAGGWLLAEITPIAVRAALEGLGMARAARLRAERAKLVETWGLETLPGDQ